MNLTLALILYTDLVLIILLVLELTDRFRR